MATSYDKSVVIRLEDVSKRYQLRAGQGTLRNLVSSWSDRLLSRNGNEHRKTEFWSLKGVSFQVQQGEALGIIGHNGAGKTTILKLLAGITRPTSGRIFASGRLSSLIELGAGFHPDLTGRENIFLNGVILGLTRRQVENRFDEIVAFSELEDFLDTPIKRYSSGMKVRLGFAVAVHTDPEILLVDEVLAVGDLSFRHKCVNKIQALREKHGCTIVFVSHSMWAVNSVCNRALLLTNGQVMAKGDTRQVIAAYEGAVRKIEKARLSADEDSNKDANLGSFTSEGSGEILITGVQLLDSAGQKQTHFEGGETVKVRVHYLAFQRIEHPNVEIYVTRSDGVTCSVSRSTDANVDVPFLEGRGYLDAEILDLQLNSGVYKLEVRFTDNPPMMPYAASKPIILEISVPIINTGPQAGVYFPQVIWRQPIAVNEPRKGESVQRMKKLDAREKSKFEANF